MSKNKLFGWPMVTVLLGVCVPAAAQESSLLLVHGPAEAFGATPTWCYSTLADPDCYTQPIPAANDRLIGAYLPAEAVVEPPAMAMPGALSHQGNGDGDRCRDHHHGEARSGVCEHSDS